MSKKEVSSDYLRAKGLSESEIAVYSTVLGLGNATIGEINLVLDMELPEIYVQIKQLEEIGYIKQVPGKVPRYIAMEPFLRDYSRFSSELKFNLISIKDRFHAQMDEFNTKIKTVIPRLQEFCSREKTQRFDELAQRFDRLEENLNTILKNSHLEINHAKQILSVWPSESIEETLPAFEENLEQSKEKFVKAISGYADSLVIDAKELRERLEKATIQHKVFVAERLDKLRAEINDPITQMKDDVVKTNFDLSQKYSAILDEKDITSRERAAEIIHGLIQNVVILAREKEGDISSDTAQMINNALGPLFNQFDNLQQQMISSLEKLLEGHSQEITKTVRQTQDVVKNAIPETLEVVTLHLDESRDESAKFIDQKITEPFEELEKIKGDINQDLEVFQKNIKIEARRQDELGKKAIEDKTKRILEKIDLAKVEVKDSLSLTRINLEDAIDKCIKHLVNDNKDKIELTNTIIEEAKVNLSQTLGNTIFLLEDSGKTFDGIVNMSEKVMPIEELAIDLVHSKESIQRVIKDMLLRAKEELVLVTPEINTDFLYEIEKQPQITNYQIISHISEKDVALLTQLIKRGNVSVMNYKEKDYWIAIRDNEEIIFAPKIHDEKIIGFLTDNPHLFKLFYELTNEKIFTKMKVKEIAV
ncbi:MAG: hypothetical protein GF308_02645 [Candidatus Heimdallarchaeota archaeon]|nr:hypothetical protein [Candidatus Heimdallarchaeota archaeon]